VSQFVVSFFQHLPEFIGTAIVLQTDAIDLGASDYSEDCYAYANLILTFDDAAV